MRVVNQYSATRRLVVIGLAIASVASAVQGAPLSLTIAAGANGVGYTQSFNDLPAVESNYAAFSAALPSWTAVTGATSRTTTPTLRAGSGSDNAGGLYSFGSSAADRALGSVSSGNATSGGTIRYGIAFTNNTNRPISGFTAAYTGEQWRLGSTGAQTVAFQYNVAATDAGIDGTYASASSALTFNAPRTNGSGAAVDGNLAANRAVISATVVQPIARAQVLNVRFEMTQPATGSSHGLAIDDFSLTPTFTALTLRRRDTGNGSWTTGGNADFFETATDNADSRRSFLNNDAVTFDDTVGGVITIQSTGVAPASTAVSAAAGTYTFANGPLVGSGGLTKSNAGTLRFTANNTYIGPTIINGGTLVADGVETATTNQGNVQVNSTGTLAGRLTGTGTLKRTVTVNAGGTVSAGAAGTVGTLTTNGQTWNATGPAARGTYEVDVASASNTDRLVINGNLAVVAAGGGKFVIKLVGTNATGFTPGGATNAIPIATGTGTVTYSLDGVVSGAFDASLFELDLSNFTASGFTAPAVGSVRVAGSGGNFTIFADVQESPEPATAALVLLGGGVLLTRRPRGKK